MATFCYGIITCTNEPKIKLGTCGHKIYCRWYFESLLVDLDNEWICPREDCGCAFKQAYLENDVCPREYLQYTTEDQQTNYQQLLHEAIERHLPVITQETVGKENLLQVQIKKHLPIQWVHHTPLNSREILSVQEFTQRRIDQLCWGSWDTC